MAQEINVTFACFCPPWTLLAAGTAPRLEGSLPACGLANISRSCRRAIFEDITRARLVSRYVRSDPLFTFCRNAEPPTRLHRPLPEPH